MRLPDIVNQIQRRVSEGTNVIRHPFQAAYRVGRKRFQGWYENASIPGTGGKKPKNSKDKESKSKGVKPKHKSRSDQSYVVSGGSPRNLVQHDDASTFQADELGFEGDRNGSDNGYAQHPQQGSSEQVLFPQKIESYTSLETTPVSSLFASQIPPLQPGEILQGGWWGRYTVGYCIQELPWIRLYEGVTMNGNEPIWAYEYLFLERSFNQQEAEERLDAFRQLINQNLRLGNGSDFRIVKLKDVMVDARGQRRGYLITSPVTEGVTLKDYLKQTGPMTAKQVTLLLQQVLQSLQYLHTAYHVRWLGDRSDRGLVHGNLTLESLWIRWGKKDLSSYNKSFFIYLSRFALWEHVCWSPGETARLSEVASSPHELGTVSKDLADLGQIAFALLSGDAPDAAGQFTLSPTNESHWPKEPEAQILKPFIIRLLGIGPEEPYKSADTALTALRMLLEQAIPQSEVNSEPALAPEESPDEAASNSLWWFIGAAVALVFLAVISVLGHRLFKYSRQTLTATCQSPCTIDAVVNQSSIRSASYSVQTGTSWARGLSQILEDSSIALEGFGQQRSLNLETILEDRSKWELDRLSLENLNESKLLNLFQENEIQFALVQEMDLGTENLANETLAQDAIVFFVVFSDENRLDSLPRLLDGKISLNDLRRFYGESTARLLNKPVRLYFPPEESTVELLKRQLIEQGMLSTEAEAEFERLWQQDRQDARESKLAQEQDILYARMLKDFEADLAELGSSKVIGIGFDRLSRVFGQCSVYPLALETRNNIYPILVDSANQPVTPTTDLCGDKGGYWINVDSFKQNAYPFRFDLSAVYPLCEVDQLACEAGQTFVEMMKTTEGQYLLSEVGLIPLKPIDQLRRTLWSNRND